MGVLGGNNDMGWEGHWYEPDETLWLKRQRRRNESRTGQTMTWQHMQWGGLSHFDIHVKSHVHTTGSSKQQQQHCVFCGLEILFLLCTVPLWFLLFSPLICCTGAFCPHGYTIHRAVLYTESESFLHVGWYYWKLSGSLLCEQCCRELGSGPAWGLVQHCSALTACISLSCGPWPPDAFPDPRNRINTSAWPLGSHSHVHSCALAWPSPVRPSKLVLHDNWS